MKGTVLTRRSDPIQAVSVIDDNGVQIAIVTVNPGSSDVPPAVSLARTNGRYPSTAEYAMMRRIAGEALRERDMGVIRSLASIMHQSVIYSIGVKTYTPLTSVPSKRKVRFSFVHRPVDAPAVRYDVSIRASAPQEQEP